MYARNPSEQCVILWDLNPELLSVKLPTRISTISIYSIRTKNCARWIFFLRESSHLSFSQFEGYQALCLFFHSIFIKAWIKVKRNTVYIHTPGKVSSLFYSWAFFESWMNFCHELYEPDRNLNWQRLKLLNPNLSGWGEGERWYSIGEKIQKQYLNV